MQPYSKTKNMYIIISISCWVNSRRHDDYDVCNVMVIVGGLAVRRYRYGSVIHRMNEHYSTLGPVSTGMDDRLWVDMPTRYVTNPTRPTSLASLWGR